jgi:hypothetical protein
MAKSNFKVAVMGVGRLMELLNVSMTLEMVVRAQEICGLSW